MTLHLCAMKTPCPHSPAVCQLCNPDMWAPPKRRNGCHNRPALGVKRTVQDGYYQEYAPGTVMPLKPQFTLVPHAMSTDCQYTSSEAGRVDPGCTGCHWRAA